MPCIKSLIADYKKAGGVCSGSNNYAGYPVAETPSCVGGSVIQQGLCSEDTESLLLDKGCINYVWNNKQQVQETIHFGLIHSMCSRATFDAFRPASDDRKLLQKHINSNNDNFTKLLPILAVFPGPGPGYSSGPISDLVNTRDRYSWLCSLRFKADNQCHICGVTLLSMPPSPTVLISSAHCVTVCRSEAMNKIVDNCCCDNVGGERCSNNPDCGDDAEVVNMTGEDGEIICGEWETGPTPASESGEEYNIILPIKNIIRHPEYKISRGDANSQFVSNDLAVFLVDDEELTTSDNIVPVCLPSANHQSSLNGVHAGWSSPPPLEFLEQNLPLFVPYHKEFFKQWHYFMKIRKCQDPEQNYKYPSNSYYPPGTMCAEEKYNEFCPSSGESGSPLMSTENNRYTANGLLSFIKGCSAFTYLQATPMYNWDLLTQESLNPSVYTKLSCYLPWIAQQYNMEYEANDIIDPDCVTGSGDINEVTASVCTAIPTPFTDVYALTDNVEAKCLFNFSGKLSGNK